MEFGEPKWQCVTVDEPDVPRCGQWGNVEWFGRQCAEHGLQLVWSRRHECFMVFSQTADDHWTCQEIYRRGLTGPIIPLTELAMWSLIFLFNRGARYGGARVFQVREQLERDRKRAEQAAYRAHLDDVGRDALQQVMLETRSRTPVVAPLPRQITLMRDHRARQRRRIRARRVRNKRILLPHEVR